MFVLVQAAIKEKEEKSVKGQVKAAKETIKEKVAEKKAAKKNNKIKTKKLVFFYSQNK